MKCTACKELYPEWRDGYFVIYSPRIRTPTGMAFLCGECRERYLRDGDRVLRRCLHGKAAPRGRSAGRFDKDQ